MSAAILTMLSEVGAIVTHSHFVYTGGDHGTAYVNKDAIYPHIALMKTLSEALVMPYIGDDAPNVDVVVGPALGGIALAHWSAMAIQIYAGRSPLAVYAEKIADDFQLTRGYDALVRGKNVLVVEDILNSGGSAEKVVKAVGRAEGNVIGVAAICNRGSVTSIKLGVPKLHSLLNISLERWPEAQCPQCRDNVPINTRLGKGREFLARKGQSVA